jgi:hypothetical protein
MSGEDIFSRWSRRCRAVAQEEATKEPEPAEAPAADAPDALAEVEERSDAEILEALGLRDPDELQKGDDFTAYLKQAVPEHLRRRALRRLWRSDPRLAVLDGLNDYDGDYTGGTVPKGTLKTAYRVGEGIVRKVVEASEDKDLAEAPPPAPGPAVRPPDPAESVPPEPAPEPEDSPAEQVAEAAAPPEEEPPAMPSRRRMVFRSADGNET